MLALNPGERVVALGTFVYAGSVECDVRVVFSPIRYGSGDFEDQPGIAEDFVEDTYYVQYGSVTERGVFNAFGGGFSTLAEARAAAESAPGIGVTVRWRSNI